MLDPLLRRNFVYEVADSFGSTKTKIENLLNEHNSGKMEEGGVFTYRLNLMINPGFFNSNQVVYGGLAGSRWKKYSHSFYDCTKCWYCIPYSDPIPAIWVKCFFW
jgi:hypothetical protein